jgi:hypothetical protein
MTREAATPQRDPADAPLREALELLVREVEGHADVEPTETDGGPMEQARAALDGSPTPMTPTERFTNQYLGTFQPAPAPLDVLDVDALAEALLAWFPKQAIGSDTDVRMAADHITAEYARLAREGEER